MSLAETAIFAGISSTLIILAYHFFRMEDDKVTTNEKMMFETYKTLREKILDPILQDIIANRKAKIDPAKFMVSPEVIEKLTRYRKNLNLYNDANGKQLGISISLHLASVTSLFTGITVIVLTIVNEFYIDTSGNTSGITTFHIFILTIIILIIGSIFIGSFILLYRKHNNDLKGAVRLVTQWFY